MGLHDILHFNFIKYVKKLNDFTIIFLIDKILIVSIYLVGKVKSTIFSILQTNLIYIQILTKELNSQPFPLFFQLDQPYNSSRIKS